MKKIFVFVIFIITAISLHSQDGNLKKQTYFRVGLSVPSWKYLGNAGKSDWIGEVKRTGGIFEVGSIFMLNSIKLAPGMRIGVNVDYLSLNYHGIKTEDQRNNFFYAGSKIGPSLSYCPVQKLTFDAYFKFNPVWIAGDIYNSGSELTDDEIWLGFMGIKYSVGLNIRYAIVMLGIEINPGYARFKYYSTDDNELTNIYMGNVNNNNDRTPVPGFNITAGLSF